MTDPTNHTSRFEIPTVIVLFGITGDLVRRKILHAIFNLHNKKVLPEKFKVFGFARREYNNESLRGYLKGVMIEKNYENQESWDEFLFHFFYVRGTFNDTHSYNSLTEGLGRVDEEWNTCSNKLFYLAVPPGHYKSILHNINGAGLTKSCSEEEGWTRVILEKPFGSDLQTAIELDTLLGQLFKEEQIYRVDHYLAKETVRNILAFRFGNSFLEPTWNKENIEKIEIRMFEKQDVNERVEFYDSVGAFRDFGKNHMLQLLALATMDSPDNLSGDAVRKKRSAVFGNLHSLTPQDVAQNTIRGRYQGYLVQDGVKDGSNTETFFHIKTHITNGSLKDVPLHLIHGKALDRDCKEIVITFKKKEPFLFSSAQKNILYYQISPEENIKIKFFVKKPGYTDELDEQDFGFEYHSVYDHKDEIEAYEQVFLDIVKGDQTLFVSTEEIINQWKFVEPILQQWYENNPECFHYEKGSMPDKKLGSD